MANASRPVESIRNVMAVPLPRFAQVVSIA